MANCIVEGGVLLSENHGNEDNKQWRIIYICENWLVGPEF